MENIKVDCKEIAYLGNQQKQATIQNAVHEKVSGFFSKCAGIVQTPLIECPAICNALTEKEISLSPQSSACKKTAFILAFKIATGVFNDLRKEIKKIDGSSTFLAKHTFLKLNAFFGFFPGGKIVVAAVAFVARAVMFVALSAIVITFAAVRLCIWTSIQVVTFPLWGPATYAYYQSRAELEPRIYELESALERLTSQLNGPLQQAS